MKTLKVEDVYVAGYESFLDVAGRLPKFIEQVYMSTTRDGCTQPLATNRRKNLKPNTPRKRLSSARSHGPA
jgi:hypothetical protein